MAFFIGNRDLAVEHGGCARQRRQRLYKGMKLLGPIEAVASTNDDFLAREGGDGAIAVVFYLMEPALAGRRFVDEGRELRSDERREPPVLFF